MSLFAKLGQDPEESQILQALECRQTLGSPQRCPKDAAAHNRHGGEISTVSFICLVTGLRALHTSAAAPVWFLFSTFFFFSPPCWVVYCLGLFESYHWNICILHNDTQLVVLQGQHWEMLDLPEVHADSQM